MPPDAGNEMTNINIWSPTEPTKIRLQVDHWVSFSMYVSGVGTNSGFRRSGFCADFGYRVGAKIRHVLRLALLSTLPVRSLPCFEISESHLTFSSFIIKTWLVLGGHLGCTLLKATSLRMVTELRFCSSTQQQDQQHPVAHFGVCCWIGPTRWRCHLEWILLGCPTY